MSAIATLQHASYLAAAVLFIVGLKRLSSPATARSGNLVAAAGMVVAVVATLVTPGLGNWGWIALGLAFGVVAGLWAARLVAMTAMPQMVAILNGLGGGSAALVATSEFLHAAAMDPARAVSELLATVIGAVSFSGSLVAFAKLQGLISERALAAGWLRFVNGALVLALLVTAGLALAAHSAMAFVAFLLAALAFGVLMVLPIGGADMPVVISLLNSFTGLAAAFTGFSLGNPTLIISGTLVGASGTLLTRLMCRAMNRSLANVLFGGFGAAPAVAPGATATNGHGPVKEIGVDDAATLLANVRSLVIVPGYGMAVAQAQHAVRDLAGMLENRGVDVRYAIHPVAGRMPGHMNVLLAEANVPYTQLYDLDQINDQFPNTDVALVIGANDVVNPSARTDPASPIYGMPILDADRARHVIVIKRSLNPGFAGIDNPLYYEPRTLMLFGDARGAVDKLVHALKDGA